MRKLSLCSGIGADDLASTWAGIETVCFCEIDPFCQSVLRRHWPDVPIIADIKDVNYETLTNAGHQLRGAKEKIRARRDAAIRCGPPFVNEQNQLTQNRQGTPPHTEVRNVARGRPFGPGEIDLIAGGIPCQGNSIAGRYQGADDSRNLWPEMRRIIREIRPKWVLVENVPGLRSVNAGRLMGGILADLAEMGYHAGWCSYGACDFGAPHRRERVFIVAYAMGKGLERPNAQLFPEKPNEQPTGFLRPSLCDPADPRLPDWAGGQVAMPYPLTQPERPGGKRATIRSVRVMDARLAYRLARHRLTKESRGIMGFITLLRRYYYATTSEYRTREVLCLLHEAFAQENSERAFRRLRDVLAPETLRCLVHGEGDEEGKGWQNKLPLTSKTVSSEVLRQVQQDRTSTRSSQGSEHSEQCSCQFDYVVSKLSLEISLGKWGPNTKEAQDILFNMWQASKGQVLLSNALSAMEEVWRSFTHEEAGKSCQYPIEQTVTTTIIPHERIERIKALGNCNLPQMYYPVYKAIVEIARILA